MALRFCSLASGSSGNGYFVSSGNTLILIDGGSTIKNFKEGLEALGKTPEDLQAVLITHEHSDHVGNLTSILKKANTPVMGSIGTLDAIKRRMSLPAFVVTRAIEYLSREEMERSGESKPGDGLMRFSVGDIAVTAFPLSHDAASPWGYSLSDGEEKITIVTDTGTVTPEILLSARDSDLLVLESNHEQNVLMTGNYPYELKLRILSDHGHLSNEAAANFLVEFLMDRTTGKIPTIALAHLSRENNSPDLARITVNNILNDSNYFDGNDYSLEVLPAREIWVY